MYINIYIICTVYDICLHLPIIYTYIYIYTSCFSHNTQTLVALVALDTISWFNSLHFLMRRFSLSWDLRAFFFPRQPWIRRKRKLTPSETRGKTRVQLHFFFWPPWIQVVFLSFLRFFLKKTFFFEGHRKRGGQQKKQCAEGRQLQRTHECI